VSVRVTCRGCGQKNRVVPQKKGSPRCGKCKASLDIYAGGSPVEIDDAGFAPFVKNAPRPVLVDFWAAWCAPCRMMAPVLEEFARSQDGILVAKVDIEMNPRTPGQFSIFSIPTLILFENGEEAHRLTSAVTIEVLRSQLKPWLAVH